MFERTYPSSLRQRLRLCLACAIGTLGAWALLVPTPAVAADTATVAQQQRFVTDEPVRVGMLAIRQKMLAQEGAIANHQLGAGDYEALAQSIEADMQNHLAQRSLPKAAAVAFNGSIWQDLSSSVGLMRNGRSVAVQRTGALGVQQVLRYYPQYFEHPGW